MAASHSAKACSPAGRNLNSVPASRIASTMSRAYPREPVMRIPGFPEVLSRITIWQGTWEKGPCSKNGVFREESRKSRAVNFYRIAKRSWPNTAKKTVESVISVKAGSSGKAGVSPDRCQTDAWVRFMRLINNPFSNTH